MENSNGIQLHLVSSSGDVEKVRQVDLPRHVLDHRTPVIILIRVRSGDTRGTCPQSAHSYLKQFRKVYEEKGWITVQCTPTENRVARGEADDIVSTLFSCLQNRGLHQNPIIIHVVGHTGLPVLNAIYQFVKDEKDLGNIISVKGCILDSCPKPPDGLMDKMREFWPSVYDCWMLVTYFMQVLYPELFGQETGVNHYDTFCSYPGWWPQLYLYSTADHVVPYSGVEKAISMLSHAGVSIETKRWDDSKHTRHVFDHEQEYTEMCQQFVHRCVGYSQPEIKRTVNMTIQNV